MAFEQLYYTSCEQGLAGIRGYQFNAATPGAPVVPGGRAAVVGVTMPSETA